MPGFNCDDREYPVCPNCGYIHIDIDDFDFSTTECLETWCPECEEDIVIIQHVRVLYSTRVAT